jgi:hypothetical protein
LLGYSTARLLTSVLSKKITQRAANPTTHLTSYKLIVSKHLYRSRPGRSIAKSDQMTFKDENTIDKDIAGEIALLTKRSYTIYRENMAPEQQINVEQIRQTTYKKMKITKDGLIEDIAKNEEEQARLIEKKAEISRQSELMEAEVLETRKAAGAKQENEDETAKE